MAEIKANTYGGYECCIPFAALRGFKIPTGPTRVYSQENIIESQRRPSAAGVAFAAMAAGNVGIKPLHVVGLLWFREPIDRRAFQTLVEEKLLVHERFASKVRVLPYNKTASTTGCPLLNRTFVKVPVDLDYHVQVRHLPGLDSDPLILQQFVCDIHSTQWDMERPLWRFFIVPNADSEGRCVLVAVFDHCVGDGVSFVQVLVSLMDDEDGPASVHKYAPPPKRTLRSLPLYRHIKAVVKGTWDAVFGLWQAADSPNALKLKESSDHLCLATGEKIPLACFKDIQEAYKHLDVTLNDVFIALITLTVYSYLKLQGDPIIHLKKPRLHIDIPLDMKKRRIGVDPCDIGNSVQHITLRLPLESVANGRSEVVRNVVRKVNDLKISPKHHMEAIIGECFVATTPQIEAREVLSELLNKTTCIFANVPGPQKEVSLCGQRLEDLGYHDLSPVGLLIGLLTYNGMVYPNVTTDSSVLAEPELLCRMWHKETHDFYEDVCGHPIGAR